MKQKYQRLSVITNPAGRKEIEGFLEGFLVDGIFGLDVTETYKIHYVFKEPLSAKLMEKYSRGIRRILKVKEFGFYQVDEKEAFSIRERFRKLGE